MPRKLDYASPKTDRPNLPSAVNICGILLACGFGCVTALLAVMAYVQFQRSENGAGYALLLCTGLAIVGLCFCLCSVWNWNFLRDLLTVIFAGFGGIALVAIFMMLLLQEIQNDPRTLMYMAPIALVGGLSGVAGLIVAVRACGRIVKRPAPIT